MGDAVLWLVLWFVFAIFGAPLVAFVGNLAGLFAIASFGSEDNAVGAVSGIGAIILWLGAAALFVGGIVLGILQIISVVQLATA